MASILGLGFVIPLLSLLLGGFESPERLQNMALHSAIEMAGAVIAAMVAYLLLRLNSIAEGTSFNYQIAAALLVMSCLDGLHSIMPEGNIFVWLHSMATFFGGLLFAMVWLPSSPLKSVLKYWPSVSMLIAIVLGGYALVQPEHVPQMLASGQFTQAAVILNIGGGLFLVLAAIKLILTYRSTKKSEDLLFFFQCLILAFAAIMFEQSSIWDTPWWGWHIQRLAGYSLALWLVVKTANAVEVKTLLSNRLLKRQIEDRELAEQGMQDQQARINGIVDAAMDAIVSTDEEQNIVLFNRGAERMFGHLAADIIGQPLDLLVPVRFREKHRRHVEQYGKRGITTRTMSQPGQSYGLRANGEEFPFEATISRVKVAEKMVFTAILRDTTQRKLTEDELRIAAVAFESKEGMLVTDAKGIILRVNQAFTETTGYTSEEVVGQTPSILKSGRHNADFYHAMWENIHRTGTWQGEIWDRRKNGEIYPKWLTITAVKGGEGSVTHYVGSHIDITERKVAEEKIKDLAFYDPLTRLPNRRLLLDRLQHALASSARSGREGALLFIDLDNFKTLNDTLGHNIGDLLLQHVAQRLESCVREGDTVARLGGDEFVVMLEDLSENAPEAAEQTEAVGEKILVSLNQPYQLASYEYHSTPSIGVTLFSDRQLGIEDLLKQADIAMYQAKKAGRNALRFFDPQMQDTISARAAIENELRNALENRQFHLYYQIQLDTSYRPLGAEALIRWIHPERGLVSPAQFIPVAEETGLILPIGQWVLEAACIQLKAWEHDARTSGVVLSINVSARQFHQVDFVVQVQDAVRRHDIDPKMLKLELTESMLFENIEEIITTMNALKEIGVKFSLDDFGTGFSSLQYLKRLPLDQLKIDQSFVRDIAIDSSDKAIVSTIIAMAHSLGLDVIAEGVETQEQRQFLLDAGCTHFQGYLFGRPVPVGQFETSLRQ